MKFILTLFLFTLSLSSCWTIHFKNSNSADTHPNVYEFDQWHHIGLFGLVEFSDPVPLKQICSKSGGEWDSVRTQTGFLQAFIRIISYSLKTTFSPIVINIGRFYSPEQVSVQCSMLC